MWLLFKRGPLIVLLLLAAGGGGLYYRYPGLTVGLLNHLRHATWGETRNLLSCISYWLTLMQELRLDPSTGTYDFPTVDSIAAGNSEMHCLRLFHLGRFTAAAACLDGEIERHGESSKRLFWLAMSYLRQAEAENCLSQLLAERSGGPPERQPPSHRHRPSEYCTLPVGRFHEQPEPALQAAAILGRLLERDGSDDRLHRWLLNFSLMTVGGFPQDVPARYRIRSPFIDQLYGEQRQLLENRYAYLSFEDRAPELNVDSHDTGRGVAVEDLDGDGDLDIVSGGMFEKLRFFRNEGGHHFVDRTDEAGLGGVLQPSVITAADYDNDGWIDLFVARPLSRYTLLRNNQKGSFVDVTSATGLLDAMSDDEIAATWATAWGDIDNDGDLDLVLAQWAFRLPFVRGIMARPRMDSKLFINQEGRFLDGTEILGLSSLLRDKFFVGAAFGDYDGDGFVDLFLSSPLRRSNLLLRNRSAARFEKVEIGDRGEPGFFAGFVDVNHDGRLDIFKGGFADARTSTEQTVFGEHLDTYRSGRSTILLQSSDGDFENRHDLFAGQPPMGTMGVSYGDVNNDGCLDFYMGTGGPEPWFILPNLMFIGQTRGRACTGRMENIEVLEGFGTVQKGHGIVFFDFDNDGDQDIYSSLGGMWPADRWPNQFFVNESRLENSWLRVRLRGRASNYFGVGARITVIARAGDGSEIVRRYQMDGKTGFGSSPYVAHIGLLDSREVMQVRVVWPGSGCEQLYPASVNRTVTLDEQAC